MRSQLSTLEKLDMGRVRRRTSRKARSMTLVVRTLIQCSCGTAKKFSSASRSRSTQATALGRRCCQCCFQSRKARSASLLLLARYMAEAAATQRSEEHTSELQSLTNLVCRLLLEKKK